MSKLYLFLCVEKMKTVDVNVSCSIFLNSNIIIVRKGYTHNPGNKTSKELGLHI
jgi:hypothetical protein